MKLKSIFASLVMTAALFSSCDRDVNDWEVATGENRLFKPLIFEASTLKPTSCLLYTSQSPRDTR